MAEFRLWLLSLIDHWSKIVTGGVVAAILTAGAAFKLLPAWTVGLWVIAAIAWASFLSWRKLHLAYAIAKSESETLSIRETPKLLPHVERLTVNTEGGEIRANPMVFALVSVANDGHKSSARKWQMSIMINEEEKGVGEVSLGSWKYVEDISDVDWSVTPAQALTVQAFDNDGSLEVVTQEPIERGERREGFFLGLISAPRITIEDLRTIRIRCEDFQGTTYTATLPPGNIHLGSINIDQKRARVFPPYGFKALPAGAEEPRSRLINY